MDTLLLWLVTQEIEEGVSSESYLHLCLALYNFVSTFCRIFLSCFPISSQLLYMKVYSETFVTDRSFGAEN